uniref:BPI2 domain-containing protein n=1 Tax=Globodera pallida TaxID=36090 RepID=A0A183BT55_GLOPA
MPRQSRRMGQTSNNGSAAKGTVNNGRTVNARSVMNNGAIGLVSPRLVHQQQRRDIVHFPVAPLAPHAMRPTRATALATFARWRRELGGNEDKARADRATASDSGRLAFVDPGENLCANCPKTGGEDNFMASVLQSMDMSKLDNVFLDVRLLNTHATNRDFTVEVVGEFSVGGRGGTPFGAFPMQFPGYSGGKMVDILISDFTMNSLFYHLQSVGFLRIRMGPETPKYGDLLKTTCTSEEDSGLEDHGVETEDGASAVVSKKGRVRRQDAGDLTGLGVCLGDILPAVREQYPNQRVYVFISTIRAPSILLSSQNGGVAFLNFLVDIDFYIQSTNQKVGTIRVASDVRVTIRTNGAHVTGHADVTHWTTWAPSAKT